MNFFKKLLKDDDEIYDEKYKDDYAATEDEALIDDIPPAEGENTARRIPEKSADVSLRVMRPKSYDDGPEIADYVASGCTVVMNIEDLNRENSRRLIDFLLGAVHVLGGDLQMASQTTFVVAPCSVDVKDRDGETSDDDGIDGFTFK
ncbi:MAG: cell division protein SepF [Clostridia bacterium]|nr:cell division protein SepF [Clostridia bacterium]